MTRHAARIIFHADLDAFYASVEQLDNPELRGMPVVVGGSPEHRGVVTAASYEARAFGIHSAMPMSRALRLCPHAVRVSPRFDRYGEMSRRVMAIFRSFTPLVEPLSLDEAFLDVTDAAPGMAAAEALARDLRRRVRDETGLTVSIGVAANKSVAKIASDRGKPDGLTVVLPGGETAFLAPLPIRALWGVGPRTEQGLQRAGIRTVGDLARLKLADAARLLGSRGEFLHAMARGIDEREIVTDWERKSVGAETTFAHDLGDGPELRAILRDLAADVARRLARTGFAARTVSLKLRYADFKTISRQSSVEAPVVDAAAIERIAGALLDRVAGGQQQFRLLGIHCSKLVDRAEAQPPLPLEISEC
jgi:DNA polymerase-4